MITTADISRLIRATLSGLREVYKPGFRYKKRGFLLLAFAQAEPLQGSLFLRPDDPRRVALMGAVDNLNRHYDRDRVRYTSTSIESAWKLRLRS